MGRGWTVRPGHDFGRILRENDFGTFQSPLPSLCQLVVLFFSGSSEVQTGARQQKTRNGAPREQALVLRLGFDSISDWHRVEEMEQTGSLRTMEMARRVQRSCLMLSEVLKVQLLGYLESPSDPLKMAGHYPK